MLNKKSILITLLLITAVGFSECGRRGSSFGYGFLGGFVGSAVCNTFAAPRPTYVQPAPPVVVQQPVVVERVVVQPEPVPAPQVQYQQTVTTNTVTTCPHCTQCGR